MTALSAARLLYDLCGPYNHGAPKACSVYDDFVRGAVYDDFVRGAVSV
jgi:hypothetical protein